MAYKILENNAVDITNIDGAAFNNFSSGNRDGIVGGWANECIVSATGNSVLISTGLLILRGVRFKITEIESITLSSTPSSDTRYQIIAQITKEGEAFTPTLFVQVPISLIQDDIINSEGVYQIELGRFTHTALGTITDVVRTADVLYGGASVTADVDVGDVTTDILAPGLDAEIDIDKRVEGKKTVFDFHFSLPATAGTAVIIDDVEQASISFTSDPQAQINDKVSKDGDKVLSDNNYTTAEKNKLSGIEAGAQVNPTPVNNLTSTSIVLPLAANLGRVLNVNKAESVLTGTLENLSITASIGVKRVYGKAVSGTLSGSAELYLVNCTGTITISGNNAKIYAFNCPALTINGVNQNNWQNIYRDGRASFQIRNSAISCTAETFTEVAKLNSGTRRGFISVYFRDNIDFAYANYTINFDGDFYFETGSLPRYSADLRLRLVGDSLQVYSHTGDFIVTKITQQIFV